MKSCLLQLTCAYLFVVWPAVINAAVIHALPTGLSSPTNQITFEEFAFPTVTPITNEYNALGVTFSYGLYMLASNNEAAAYGLLGNCLINTWGVSTTRFPIYFNNDVSDAAFVMQANAGQVSFSALLGRVVVETCSSPYYGFRDISFNEIRIASSNTGVIALDDLQFNVATVPIPPPSTSSPPACSG